MPPSLIALGAKPRYWSRAIRALGLADPVLGAVIAGARSEGLRRRSDAFTMLARAIVGQQVSVRSADAIWSRFAALLGAVEPATLMRFSEAELRAAGLTRQKAHYLHVLAEGFLHGALRTIDWAALDDEAAIVELTRLKGIGRWTAEMFLIFHLTRPDVLPLGDVGLRRAVGLSYRRDQATASEAMVERIGAAWRPWRTVATWYLWRSLDPLPVEY
jgi:DNA-3-methyladenine glycosylase II